MAECGDSLYLAEHPSVPGLGCSLDMEDWKPWEFSTKNIPCLNKGQLFWTLSYWCAVSSGSMTCRSFFFGQSLAQPHVRGNVADATSGKEQESPCSAAHLLLGFLAVYSIVSGSLERSNCFVMFPRHLEQSKGEASRLSRGALPLSACWVWSRLVLYLLRKELQLLTGL